MRVNHIGILKEHWVWNLALHLKKNLFIQNQENVFEQWDVCVSIMKPTWCTFHSIYWESKVSTCFEHYLLTLRRRYTNGIWYIAFV
jgi:hypothetical protein